jgi:predicted PurR-regulated permease PerM
MNEPALNTALTKQNAWQERWFHVVVWAAIITLFWVFLQSVRPILLPFVLGLFVAYLMDPLACWMQKRGMGRSLATSIITLGLFATLTALVMWLVPILYAQLTELISKAPRMLHQIETNIYEQMAPLLKSLSGLTGNKDAAALPTDFSDVMQTGILSATQFSQHVFASGAAALNVAALLLITPIVCFYLIRDWPAMLASVDRILPLAYAPTIRSQLYLINRTLAAYLRGQITVMLILSTFYVVAFTLIGLNFSLVLGLLAGCIIIIPYVGSIISISLGLLVAHGQFGMDTNWWLVLAVYGVAQILETQILTPKIIGDRVGLHPLWMLFGMLAGAVLLGFVGLLLAVPLTAVIGVLAKFALSRYLQSGLYLEK